MIVSQTNSFLKRASQEDSGTYTCVAGIGKVFKKSNAVRITVCGEYVLAGSDSPESGWETGAFPPPATVSSPKADQTEAG